MPISLLSEGEEMTTHQERVANFKQALREFIEVVLDELIDCIERFARRLKK